MGQYHMLVNLDRREYIYSHQLGDGLKAWEQFASGPGGVMSAAVYLMVAPTPRGGGDFIKGPYMGRWHGDRVIWVGDYAEQDDFDSTVYVGTNGESITVHADIVYALCMSDMSEVEDQIAYSKEILADETRPEHWKDAARRILRATEAGIWYANITPQVREAMAPELPFMEYEDTSYGTISRKEKDSSRMTTAMRPDMVIPLPSEEEA